MAELFLRVVNISISASWIVPAIIILRIILKNAPKWINPVLWGIVGLRLIMPFSIKSALSLIPSTEIISPEIMYAQLPAIHHDASAATANSPQIWIPAAAAVWIFGIAAALLYAIIRYIRLGNRMNTAVLLRDNIYQSEFAATPFVLGLLHPRIYLPFKITDKNMVYVIAHEQAHIRRKDHWMKPIGFLLLCLHWFNPVLWAAYSLFCRDIEFVCDELVVRQLSGEERADYSEALLSCSTSRKRLAALAFGEIGVKARVEKVLHYRKPKVWLTAAAVLACAVSALCSLTDPIAETAPMELQSGTGEHPDGYVLYEWVSEDMDHGIAELHMGGPEDKELARYEWRSPEDMGPAARALCEALFRDLAEKALYEWSFGDTGPDTKALGESVFKDLAEIGITGYVRIDSYDDWCAFQAEKHLSADSHAPSQ